MLPGMELRHLRYFVAVAEEQNVTRAALKLHVSQPALSRQVRDLEDELGFTLLERGANSMRLTEGGRAFLVEAKAVLQRAEAAVKTARAIATGNSGELHIGYAPSLTARILPPALRRFQADKPGVRVIWHDNSTEEMLSGLRENRIHLAFLVQPMPTTMKGLHFETITLDPVRIAVAPNHPFAQKRTVTSAEVLRHPLITYSRKEYPEYHELLKRLFGARGVKLRITEEHDSVTSLISAVEAGNGVAVAPDSISCISGPRLKLVPFSSPVEALSVGAAWLALSTAAKHFLNCAKVASKDSTKTQEGVAK
jgi:LysR family transcriptional regulator, benzoate and cis,cis-muconate-responsive activator of ben and cat genes